MSNTLMQFYSKERRLKLLLIQFLLLFVPAIQLFSIPTDNGDIPASLCYFFSAVFLPFFLCVFKQIKLPPWYITGLYIYVIFLAIVKIPQYGLSRSILHWLFGAYLLLIIFNVGSDVSLEEWKQILEIGFCAFAIMHFLYMIWNWRIVEKLLYTYFYALESGIAGAWIPSLTRGGRNLDCSWLGLGSFFVRGKKKFVYINYALLFAFLGCSRAGMVAIGMGILWSLVYDPIYRLTRRSIKWYALYAVVLLALLFGSGMAQAFLARCMIYIPSLGAWLKNSTISAPAVISIDDGAEVVLSGRAAIWTLVPEMFRANPFGYGVGNAMRVMKSGYGFSGYENVVHNVFLQWLLDEGIIGGLCFLSFVIALFIKQWKCRPRLFENPFTAYFLTYIILSAFQFHGSEALMIFVLGIYLQGEKNARRIKE